MSEVINPNYKIVAKHNLLRISIAGTLNEELTLNFVKDCKKLVASYFSHGWALELDLSGLEMLIDERFHVETLKALFTWFYIKGMSAMALLTGHDLKPHLMYPFEQALSDRPPYSVKVFRDSEESQVWLKLTGFLPLTGNGELQKYA